MGVLFFWYWWFWDWILESFIKYRLLKNCCLRKRRRNEREFFSGFLSFVEVLVFL